MWDPQGKNNKSHSSHSVLEGKKWDPPYMGIIKKRERSKELGSLQISVYTGIAKRTREPFV